MNAPRPAADDLAHVCVIGAGTMGRGIAQVALAAGHRVSLVDPSGEQLAAAVKEIESRLLRKFTDATTLLAEMLHTAESVEDVAPRPDTVVVEAALENLGVKQAVMTRAFEHFGASTILATNTSSLSITEIAAGTPAPARVVGMHFFNPVPAMRLVEVVTGLQTEPQIAETIAQLAISWDKKVARVRSAPGFIVNRVARPFYGEALKLLEEHTASAEVIDEVIRAAGGFRMGPFELVDMIGNDVNFTVTNTVWAAFNYDPRFGPSQVQRELVAANRLGRKSGHGFYRYDGDAGRNVPTPAGSVGAGPGRVVRHGDGEQLRTLLGRAGVATDSGDDADDAVEVPGLGLLVLTRGRTAQEESILRQAPTVVLDRCLDPAEVSALAFSSTDSRLTDAVVALLEQAGVRAFEIRDTPGLIIARVVSMLINEAHETVLHGVASPSDVDTAMMLGTGYPMGPFAWCRRWTASAVVETLDAVWATYHDPRYRTSVGLRAAASAQSSPVLSAAGTILAE